MDQTGFVLERTVGTNAGWTLDGQTVHTVKLRWRNSAVTYEGPGGPYTSPATTVGTFPVNRLRYAFVGQDDSFPDDVLIGLRFLSFEMVDLGDS